MFVCHVYLEAIQWLGYRQAERLGTFDVALILLDLQEKLSGSICLSTQSTTSTKKCFLKVLKGLYDIQGLGVSGIPIRPVNIHELICFDYNKSCREDAAKELGLPKWSIKERNYIFDAYVEAELNLTLFADL